MSSRRRREGRPPISDRVSWGDDKRTPSKNLRKLPRGPISEFSEDNGGDRCGTAPVPIGRCVLLSSSLMRDWLRQRALRVVQGAAPRSTAATTSSSRVAACGRWRGISAPLQLLLQPRGLPTQRAPAIGPVSRPARLSRGGDPLGVLAGFDRQGAARLASGSRAQKDRGPMVVVVDFDFPVVANVDLDSWSFDAARRRDAGASLVLGASCAGTR